MGYRGRRKGVHGSPRKWFKPTGSLYGWHKGQAEKTRHRHINQAIENKGLLRTSNSLLGLSNVTMDSKTKKVAKEDFEWLEKEHAKGLERARKQAR